MNPLAVGDRVAVYSYGSRATGKVIQIDGDMVTTKLDTSLRDRTYVYHIKQLRKLVKKKRREVFIIEKKDGSLSWDKHPSLEAAKQQFHSHTEKYGYKRIVRFREVKE